MSLRDMIWTGGPDKPPKSNKPDVPDAKPPITSQFDVNPNPHQVQAQTYTPPPAQAYTWVPAAPANDEMYNRLLASTSLEGTSIFKQLNNFMMPLVNVLPDPVIRFRAAYAQAGTALALTKDKFMSCFTDMANSLESEHNNFLQLLETKNQTDIVAKAAQIEKIEQDLKAAQQKINEMVEQRTRLQAEVTTAQVKIDTGRTQFEAAYQRRKNEIAQEQAKYLALLG